MNQLGIYVHVPWCRSRCHYCDFAIKVVGPNSSPEHHEYLKRLQSELLSRAGAYSGSLQSIYFGGGTPSLWEPSCIETIVGDITTKFGAATEITLEANPTDCTPEKLRQWKALGINRLSIGAQTTSKTALTQLGRDHKMGDGKQAVANAAKYFDNISVDLILGVPGSSVEKSFEELAEYSVDHISIYELTIEPNTVLKTRVDNGTFHPVAENMRVEEIEQIRRIALAHGFEHYEISSFAKNNKRSLHNQLYWNGKDYLGIGMGAASYRQTKNGAIRETNPRSYKSYMRNAPIDAEEIPWNENQKDLLWLALRTNHGVKTDKIPAEIANWLIDDNLVEQRDDGLYPTFRGFLFHNQIAARIAELD